MHNVPIISIFLVTLWQMLSAVTDAFSFCISNLHDEYFCRTQSITTDVCFWFCTKCSPQAWYITWESWSSDISPESHGLLIYHLRVMVVWISCNEKIHFTIENANLMKIRLSIDCIVISLSRTLHRFFFNERSFYFEQKPHRKVSSLIQYPWLQQGWYQAFTC